MSLLDVKVKIDVTQPLTSLTEVFPLIIGTSDTPKEYKTYSDIYDVVADYTAETPEYKCADMIFKQSSPPYKIGILQKMPTDSTASAVADISDPWRQLIITSHIASDVLEGASFVETTTDKIFFTSVSKLTELTDLKALGLTRTVAFFYPDPTIFPEAGFVGATAGHTPGTITYKFKNIVGLEPLKLTLSNLREIHEKGGITYKSASGYTITSESKTVGGDYIDDIDARDWIIRNLEHEVQGLFVSTGKVPFDSTGITMIESTVINVLHRASQTGMIAVDAEGAPKYSTNFPGMNRVSNADYATRIYRGGQFRFTLSGAIHETEIVGEIVGL